MQVHWRQSLMSYTFLAPALILLAVFTFYPLLYGAYLGFTEYNGARFANHLPPQWVGLRNFETVLGDPLFRTALANSVKYLLVVPALQLASLAVAVLVAKNIPGIALFRAAYYVPVITSVSLAAVMWEWVFNREGTLNWLLRTLHLTTPEAAFGWLNN